CLGSAAGTPCDPGAICVRGACSSENSLLDSLRIDGAAVMEPPFVPSQFTYVANVPYEPGPMTIRAVPADASATVTVGGLPAIPGMGSVVQVAATGNTVVEIDVVLPGGTVSRYTVTFVEPLQFLESEGTLGDHVGESVALGPDILVAGAPQTMVD